MPWHLSPESYCCSVAGRTVFLHAGQDRYLLLPAHMQPAFDAWSLTLGAPLPGVLAPLARAGMVLESNAPPPSPISQPVPLPVSELGRAAPNGWNGLSGWRWTGPIFRARRELRRLGFRGTLEAVRSAKMALDRPADPRPVAKSLMAARGYRSIAGDCLVQSIALMKLLHRQQSTAALVIGVTLDPFRAHCWVQHEAMVLNDGIDVVAPFTPILAL
jgi:hypothetical protein